MINRNKKLVSLFAVLVILLAQTGSLLHAAEHPFHVEDELCASFINFGQQDLSFNIVTPVIEFPLLSVDICSQSNPQIQSSFRPVYSSRAPPSLYS